MVNSPHSRKHDERVVDEGSTDQPRGGWKVTRRRSGLNESQPSYSSQSVKHAHEANKQMGDVPTRAEDLVNRGKTVVTAGSDDLVDDTSELKRDKIMAAQGVIKRKVDELKRADECSKRANLGSLPQNDDFVDAAPQLKRYKNTVTQNAATLAFQATGVAPIIGSDDGDALPSINTRSSPAIFVKAVSGLTDDQKQAVHDMGFGRLLELTITMTQAKMGHWLVENFNHMDRKLQLYGGEKIHVKEDDVYVVLGLPRGTIEITNKKKKTESELLKEWVRLYNVSKPANITAMRVLDMIQNCDGSDDWFKRNFVVLMVTCLFESTSNGMANLRVIHLLNDLSNVINMNWCSYLIRCLVCTKKSWNDNRGRKNFTGPLLFLTLFYVDKVVLSIRSVARLFPIFKAWNNELLKARERDEIVAGAFGRGYVDVDLCVEDASHRVEREVNIRDDNDTNRTSTISVQEFVQEFASKTRILATIGVEILKLVENAPKDLLDDDNFLKMQGAAHKLLGMCNEDSKWTASQRATVATPMQYAQPQLMYDGFWNNSENLAAIDAIIEAVARRDHFIKMKMHDEGPSYSLGLGLTQDEENVDEGRHNNADEPTIGGPSNVDVPPADCGAAMNAVAGDTGIECVGDETRLTEKFVCDDGHGTVNGDHAFEVAGVDAIVDNVAVDTGRPKRHTDAGSAIKSPYMQRVIDIVKKLDRKEKMIVNWVLKNQDGHDDVIIYQSDQYSVKRNVVACVAPNTPITEELINLWACIMNVNEKFKSRGSAACFFSSTYPCNELFFKGKRKKDISYKKFENMFKAEIDQTRRYNIKQIAVFIFPVHSGSFNGLMCIVPKPQNFYVLDSVGACKDEGVKESVLARAGILRESVAKYLGHTNMVKFSKAVALSIPEVVSLEWSDDVDDADAGVITMRLMETFKGRITKNWNQDMKKVDKGQLKLMRKRYCYVIASAPNNDAKDANLVAARKFQDLYEGVKTPVVS